MKKWLLVLVAGAAAALAFRRSRRQQAEQDLWREATDDLDEEVAVAEPT